MQIPTSSERLLAIAKTISSSDKFFYSAFPEFSPLEFEHFCAFLLQKARHIILELNTKQEPDGGIDLITQKDQQIWIVQIKKSDWNTGKKPKDYISLETVDRHLGVISRKELELREKYGQSEMVGYFMTLRRFSSHTLSHFANEKRMKFCDLKELKKMILDLEILKTESEIIVWRDLELARIKEEITILEQLISEKEVETQTLQSKINLVEKIIMLELLDLYRLLDLLSAELIFKNKQIGQKQMDEKISEEFAQNQEKIDEEYENLEQEYIAKKITVLNEPEEKKFKQIYRSLMHRFHPDKNQENKHKYEKITKSITLAKEAQDLTLLEDIANFPEKYFGGVLPESQYNKEILAKFVVQLQQKLAELGDQTDILQTHESLKLYDFFTQDQIQFKTFLQTKKTDLEKKIDLIRQQIQTINLISGK